MKKAWSQHLLLASRLKAFALPCQSKRATRKPHADMYIRHLMSYTSRHDQYNKGVRKHTHETFTVALFLTNNLKFAKFQRVKTKAPSKRLFHYVIPTLPPQSVYTKSRYRREDATNVVIIYDSLRIFRENLCFKEKKMRMKLYDTKFAACRG